MRIWFAYGWTAALNKILQLSKYENNLDIIKQRAKSGFLPIQYMNAFAYVMRAKREEREYSVISIDFCSIERNVFPSIWRSLEIILNIIFA